VTAFDDDGKLLGVVGLNIFVDELGNLTDLVKEALQPRTLSKTFDPTKIVLTAANASIQVSAMTNQFKTLFQHTWGRKKKQNNKILIPII